MERSSSRSWPGIYVLRVTFRLPLTCWLALGSDNGRGIHVDDATPLLVSTENARTASKPLPCLEVWTYKNAENPAPPKTITISSLPMFKPYRSELCHALDPSRITFNRAKIGVSNPLTSEHQMKNDLLDEDELRDEVCDVTHSCKATVACQWMDGETSMTCGAKVSCKTVPTHFRNAHNIRDMGYKTKVYCWWRGCDKWVSRKNFARHNREAHLNHPRSKDASC